MLVYKLCIWMYFIGVGKLMGSSFKCFKNRYIYIFYLKFLLLKLNDQVTLSPAVLEDLETKLML